MSRLDTRAALAAALTACGAAAEELLQRFRPRSQEELNPRAKSPGALVTDADLAADDAIAAAIEVAGVPGDIVSEESARDRGGGPLDWLIDPLCGTAPYTAGMGQGASAWRCGKPDRSSSPL